jgi:hypothetical protein
LDISSKNGKIVKGKYAQTKKMGIAIARSKLEEYSEIDKIPFFENHKKKDDLSDCYLQALTYILFKENSNRSSTQKKLKPKKESKANLKKELKEFLDKSIKNCSVTDLMNKMYNTVHELEFPMEVPEPMDILLPKLNMKKYLNFKYL